MLVNYKFIDEGFFEEFSEQFHDDMTLREVKEYIEDCSDYILKEHLKSCKEYTEEDVKYLLSLYTAETGICRWSITGEA